jgi:hypothetical protein
MAQFWFDFAAFVVSWILANVGTTLAWWMWCLIKNH